ncbi:MarR family transcriptional regulator [Mesorhizobium sp. LHD-90]|uniref:MarR family winged helix-turn-helix transcriptional regulator n=1 Tax=Mesorhizobium sp. LHD-90 TaxID=3071414 RepID=UPI0027DEF281|nr:MarR family transcriptional regulator [Mesorhizobium sp. LHD-90]MDQ6438091.1 MarR family transcriptional regulator [Mesorhizobium sp. LHD-90]
MSLPLAAVEAAHLIDRLDRLARHGEAGGLNPAQWEALRFVARANRFSRTPAALAEYLGSTRGTVSQTLIMLEKKGYVTRQASVRDRRSVVLGLTPFGQRTLGDDPILALASGLATAGTEDLALLVESLRSALHAMIARNGGRAFGACHTCRHFRHGDEGTDPLPHRCALLGESLSDADSRAICVEHQQAAA